MASLQPTQLLPTLKVGRGDLSIKKANSEAWLRLESPEGDKRHNCFGVWFDGGITVQQENRKTGGTCRVKLIVESPPTITRDEASGPGYWNVEAKCLEIGEPEFDSIRSSDKAPGIENARKFPLASLDKATTVIKLDRLGASNFKPKWSSEAELRHRIITLTARNAQDSARSDVPMAANSKNMGPTFTRQQTLPLPPPSQKPPQEIAFSPALQSLQGNMQERKEGQRQIWSDRMAEVEREMGEKFAEKMRELAERRRAAIAAVNAEYDLMEQQEFALLRRIEALKKEKIQRGLDELER